jgi:hypothetical protein
MIVPVPAAHEPSSRREKMPLDAAARTKLIQEYENGPARLKAALAKVPKEALAWRPAPGKWCAHEVVVHCADSETNAAMRIRYLLAEKDPVIVGYDQDVWATTFDYTKHPIAASLAAVEAVRANTVPLLRRLDQGMWAKVGRHTESGRYGAEDWLRVYAEHLEIHARQIERNVEAWIRSSGGTSR